MAITPEERALMESYYNNSNSIPPAQKTRLPIANPSQGFFSDVANAVPLAAKQRALGVGQLYSDITGGDPTDPIMQDLAAQYQQRHRGNPNDIVFNSAGDMVGSALGDPLSYLPLGGMANGLWGMAATGLGFGVASGLTTPLKAGDSRAENTAVQGITGVIAAPVIGKTAEGLGYLGQKAVDAVLPDTAPLPIANTGINVSGDIAGQVQQATAEAGRDTARGFVPRSIANLPPEQAQRAALFAKQNVPYSAGDITKDVTQQGLEDMARKGAYGEESQALAAAFREGQQKALQNAVTNTAKDIGSGNAYSGNEADVASALASQVRAKSDSAWLDVGKAYDKVQKSGAAAVPVSAFGRLRDTAGRIRNDYPIDAMPRTASALNRIDNFFENYSDKSALNYKAVDNFRKFLGNAYQGAADDSERAALGQLRTEIDNVVDDSLEQGLIKGNPATITALKNARGMAKEYFSRFEDNKIVDSIIRKDMTPESVINLTLGYGQLGAKKEAATTIDAIKNIVGEQALEFQQLKQAGLFRLLGTNADTLARDGISGIKPAKNLDTLIRTNKSLWNTLYTPEEQATITDLAKVIKEATVKEPGAVNFSGTAPALIRHINSIFGRLGFLGNLVSAGINKAAGGATKMGVQSNLAQSFAGKIAVPSIAQALARKAGTQAGAVTGATLGNDMVRGSDMRSVPVNITPDERNLMEQFYQQQQAPAAQPHSEIAPAIEKASQVSGVDADLLRKIAQKESAMNPTASNPNSSAQGLFQITNRTWRGLVKRYGKDYGINYSDRKKPEANAIMAGLLTKENSERLTKRIGRAPEPGEIYMAHFLGDYAASKLIKSKDSSNAAAALFPDAAKANRSVFYHNSGNGKPLTASELYQKLTSTIV